MALAIASRGTHLSGLPAAVRQRWREVIVQSPADDHWYSVILQRDPELFGDWLRAWFTRLQNHSAEREFLPHALQQAIGALPVSLRVQLIRAVPTDVHSLYVQDVVTNLVSGDVEVAMALLETPELEDLHWTALRDGPSEGWMNRALIALGLGWEPARIVGYTMFADSGWSGEESLHWQKKIEAFENLRHDAVADDPRRESIITAGIEYFERLRAAATERERQERVFGYGQA